MEDSAWDPYCIYPYWTTRMASAHYLCLNFPSTIIRLFSLLCLSCEIEHTLWHVPTRNNFTNQIKVGSH